MPIEILPPNPSKTGLKVTYYIKCSSFPQIKSNFLKFIFVLASPFMLLIIQSPAQNYDQIQSKEGILFFFAIS